MADARSSRTGSALVPFEAETWPIIEHEPERVQVVPPDIQEPLGTCVVHGDYWTHYCLRCGW